jgi:hypothetical protein
MSSIKFFKIFIISIVSLLCFLLQQSEYLQYKMEGEGGGYMKNLIEHILNCYNTVPSIRMSGNVEHKKRISKCEQKSSISSYFRK